MVKHYLGLFLFIILLPTQFSHAQWSVKGKSANKKAPYYLTQKFTEEEWEASNFASEEDMAWFNDARYGMFIHFGLSTYIEKDLSWQVCEIRKAPDRGSGPYPASVWTQWPQEFIFDEFDADQWVAIAKQAGMKYIVAIAKHHDGFHLWDTQYSNFKVTNTPFGKDYLKALADACHKANMKFGIYYSQRDWYHPDYAPVDETLIDEIAKPPYFKAKQGVEKVLPGVSHQKYIDYQFNVVSELCTNYGKVDIFWFDACWWGGMFTADMWESERLTRMVRELQPGIIINNRTSIPGDFDTPEQKVGMHQLRPWESCITLCKSWSYSPTPIKSKKEIIEILTSTACGNGNMLLSWGPKWTGAYDTFQTKRLMEVGDWLKLYGHTIYSTKGGPWYPSYWGGSTYRNNKVWLHLKEPIGNKLTLPKINNQLLSSTCITGGTVSFKQTENDIQLMLNHAIKDSVSTIIELTFKDDVTEMVGLEDVPSKFNDPTYGVVIKSLKPSLKQDKTSSIIIDLERLYDVTGIDILNGKTYENNLGVFEASISKDGKHWNTVEEKRGNFKHWEVSVSQFNAGIELPGVPTRFIKIALNRESENTLNIKSIRVFGK
ncbi:MAG: alpha-L-fucosidase [Aestuariibaculum sp.]